MKPPYEKGLKKEIDSEEELEIYMQLLEENPQILTENEKLLLILIKRMNKIEENITDIHNIIDNLYENTEELRYITEQRQKIRIKLLERVIDGFFIAMAVFLLSGIIGAILLNNMLWFYGLLGPFIANLIYLAWKWAISYKEKRKKIEFDEELFSSLLDYYYTYTFTNKK